MSINQQIQEVEISIEEAKKEIKFADAIERLWRNKDFRLVIEKGYLEQEALRNTYLLGDPNLPSDRYNDVLLSLRGIGELNYYLHFKKQRGELLRNELLDHEATLTELHQEDSQIED